MMTKINTSYRIKKLNKNIKIKLSLVEDALEEEEKLKIKKINKKIYPKHTKKRGSCSA